MTTGVSTGSFGDPVTPQRAPLLLRIAPGLRAILNYRFSEDFRRDAIAGVCVASVAVPVAVAYAQLAGFRPEVGLYSSILPLVAYAIFGTSGEVVIFDRSWYNRAGVEYVMGFCSKEEQRHFLKVCPLVEQFVTDHGVQLIKYWLEVSDKEQKRRFEARLTDPLRQWKLSSIDLPSRTRWFDYSRARDMMLDATDTRHAPWHILRSDDKKRARLNCIRHLLSQISYKRVPREEVKLSKRSMKRAYDDQRALRSRKFVPEKY